MNETKITVIGNLTDDPELRFTPAGHAVANFTVASTEKIFDKETSEWKDSDTLFLKCSVWRQYAENVTESLRKGTRVIVIGKLKQRQYETKEGEKRTSFEVEVEEVAPVLRFVTANLHSTTKGSATAAREKTESDPWASSSNNEAPF